MHILHFEKNFRYTDRELLAAARKVGKLATYCKRVKDEGSSIRIDVDNRKTKKRRDQVKVTVTVTLPHKVLRAASRKHTVAEALDRCIEKLEPQVKRYKEMRTKLRQKRSTNQPFDGAPHSALRASRGRQDRRINE